MSWMIAAVGGMAALGALQSRQAAETAKQEKQADMMSNAAQIQYSPWTHASVQMQGASGTPDPNQAMLTGAMQGGLTGAMMGSQFKKMAAPPTTPTPNPQYNNVPMAGGAADYEQNLNRYPSLYDNRFMQS